MAVAVGLVVGVETGVELGVAVGVMVAGTVDVGVGVGEGIGVSVSVTVGVAVALAVAGGVADPGGGAEAWRIANTGAAPQGIWQTLEAPGAYTYCLSMYIRNANAGQEARATLLLGEARAERKVTREWSRIAMTGSGDASAQTVRFGVELPAGAAVEIFGIQAEPQAGASAYKASTRGGVYEDARFGRDELPITTTGPGRHSCAVQIIHVNHL